MYKTSDPLSTEFYFFSAKDFAVLRAITIRVRSSINAPQKKTFEMRISACE